MADTDFLPTEVDLSDVPTQLDPGAQPGLGQPPGGSERLPQCAAALHAFAAERREAMRLVQAIGKRRLDMVAVGTLQWPGRLGCEFGLWLRSLSVAPEHGELVQDVRMWHDEWHAGVEQCFRLAAADQVERAHAMLFARRGKLVYAHRALERSVVALCRAQAEYVRRDRGLTEAA
jgi:uncharacterized protein (DUF849 family)